MITQLKLGMMGNFTYIIWDEESKEGAVIDPGWEVEKIINEIKKNKIKIHYILLTHCHFDHNLGVSDLKKEVGGQIVFNKKEQSKIPTDRYVEEGDILKLGNKEIKVIETPGHSAGGVCYLFDNQFLFTGDTIFGKGVYGRTDLPGGSEKQMAESLDKLKKLNKETKFYPGHDYAGEEVGILGEIF